MPKHFRATHRESGEVVEFDLGDIDYYYYPEGCGGLELGALRIMDSDIEPDYDTEDETPQWLKDYHLQYLHNGEYHDYADERSEVKEGVE